MHCKIGNERERERERDDGSRKLERDGTGKRNDINNDIIEWKGSLNVKGSKVRKTPCREIKWGASYDHLLSLSNLCTLEERHVVMRLSVLYQILNGS